MAKYPKYEHAIGTIHQIFSFLDIADEKVMPAEKKRALILASIFMHLGHLPYTYSTAHALLLACNLGSRDQDNRTKNS